MTTIDLNCVGVHQLAAGLQREGLVRPDDGAGRRVDVPVPQRALDFVDADLPRRQRVRIELGVHRVLLAPSTCTCATPLTIEMRWAMRVSAYSSSVHGGMRRRGDHQVEDRLVGRVHLGEGRRRRHALRQQARRLGDRAPARRPRRRRGCGSRSNSSVICVEPSELTEVIDSRPAIIEN